MALAKFANKDVVAFVLSVFMTIVVSVSRGNRNDSRVGRSEIGGGDVPRLVVVASNIESKFDRAVGAEVRTCAVPRELKNDAGECIYRARIKHRKARAEK